MQGLIATRFLKGFRCPTRPGFVPEMLEKAVELTYAALWTNLIMGVVIAILGYMKNYKWAAIEGLLIAVVPRNYAEKLQRMSL